ncbi:MAG: peptidoglycan-binding protein [Robiginitomaculum sp.]|nr:peptidoglycan-binding protein [Robiginitomaculum sp.]
MSKNKLYNIAGISLAATFMVASAGFADGGSNFPYAPPPDGKVGECFARVLIPAQFESYTEQQIIDDGGSRISVSQPQFAAVNQQYMVREAGYRYEVRQPVYRLVTEQVMVRPGYRTLHVVPGEYRNVTEQIQISKPRLSWKPGSSLGSMAGVKMTQTRQGEVYCLVEEPGEVQNVTKRVQVRGESVREIAVPPIYRAVTREVMVDPGGVRKIPVAARYGSINIQQLVQPARQINTPIAAQSRQITRKKQVSGESFAWIKVLCETNATEKSISEVQTMLHKQGYYQGSVTGSTDADTEAAIARYQQQMNIPHGGFLSLQTIESLRSGVRPSAMVTAAPQNTGHRQQVAQGLRQVTAPAQYSYQSSESNWSEAEYQGNYQTSNWSNSSLAIEQDLQNGNIITSLPSGEVIAQRLSREDDFSDGAEQVRGGQYLNWIGK